MERKRKEKRINEVMDICQIGDYEDTLIGRLSKGFRQRVGIAQAILHEPEVLILDEPTIGIDPIQVVETRRLIRSLGGEHTIIISTHILPEVSMVCERVIIINEGRVIAVDRPENLSARLMGSERVQMEVKGPAGEVASAIRQIKGVRDVTWESYGERSRFTVDCQPGRDLPGRDLRQELAAAVVQKGWGLLELQSSRMSLEDIFLQLITKEEL
jgi:ABC-2 type transport system ATP-binding protein